MKPTPNENKSQVYCKRLQCHRKTNWCWDPTVGLRSPKAHRCRLYKLVILWAVPPITICFLKTSFLESSACARWKPSHVFFCQLLFCLVHFFASPFQSTSSWFLTFLDLQSSPHLHYETTDWRGDQGGLWETIKVVSLHLRRLNSIFWLYSVYLQYWR